MNRNISPIGRASVQHRASRGQVVGRVMAGIGQLSNVAATVVVARKVGHLHQVFRRVAVAVVAAAVAVVIVVVVVRVVVVGRRRRILDNDTSGNGR